MSIRDNGPPDDSKAPEPARTGTGAGASEGIEGDDDSRLSADGLKGETQAPAPGRFADAVARGFAAMPLAPRDPEVAE